MSPQRACSGQMAVELAVLLPVVIVVALIDYNLMRFVGACAAFDHVAFEQIVAQGVSPRGDAREPAVDEIRVQIEQALQMKSCEVEVTAERMVASPGRSEGLTFPISPLLTRFTCTLSYHPWPSSFVVAGVSFRAPFALVHSRALVVDRYRGGVVV
ncbi:MAG: hypothetical protein SOI23_03895 [Atopobiaceae bacterium]|jgi:hypothetical protein